MEQQMTTFQFIKKLINDTPVDGLLAKSEIRQSFYKYYGQFNGLTTTYGYISMFLRSGYLQATQSVGFYRVKKHVDDFYELANLKSDAHANTDVVKSIKADELQVGGTHYKQFPYQPIKLICLCELSFIQGNIIKYILRYKFKNGLEDIKKVKHYSELALQYDDKKWMKSSCAKHVFEFCEHNNLDTSQASVVRFAIENKYHKIIELVSAMISEMSIEQ